MLIKEIGREFYFDDVCFYEFRSKYRGVDNSVTERLRELESVGFKRLSAKAHLRPVKSKASLA